ncbi:MAG: T9SS type A sorting domain-containing protein [Bacteroidota bacterium]
MKFKALLLAAFLLSFSSIAHAQVKSAARLAVDVLLPNASAYFVDSDRSSQFNTIRSGNDVLDLDARVVRSRYRITDAQQRGTTPELAARSYLEAERAAFGVSDNPDDLRVLRVVSGAYGTHVTLQQYHAGLPVYGRYVKVNLDAANRPTMVLSGFAPKLPVLQSAPETTASAAKNTARTLLQADLLRTTEPALVVFPGTTSPDAAPTLAWQLVAWPEHPAVELEILVSAIDGSVIQIQNTSTHVTPAKGNVAAHTASASTGNRTPSTSTQRVDGTGLVFDPDPLTTAGQFYGAPYLDNNDIDIDEVNAQRVLVDLFDISQDTDGMYHLIGPHVQIVGESSGGTSIYTPPAEASPNGFQYTRANDFFEAVNVYFHIDKSQRYLQGLNIGRDIQNVSIRTNPHGLGLEDNSRYFTSQNYIAFGQGGVDDAEDAHVIWHEYGHALLQGSAPGLLNSSEGQALHEGWADYWAASYARSLAENSTVPRDDWRSLFKWDSGDGSIWQGRELNFTGKYPDDTFCDGGGFQCNIYADGIMWATTLMEVYDNLGRETTDRLALASHGYLMHPVSFRDAAEAMIQSDADLHAGANVSALLDVFSEKGLLDISTFGPFVQHEALPAVEQLGGTIPVSVSATAISAPISRVSMIYTVDDGAPETLSLTSTTNEEYTAQLPLPASISSVSYYIEVEDELGLVSRLPASDFINFTFSVGPDNQAPTIQHVQQPSVTLIDWPATLVATVDDNLGIDAVQAVYRIQDTQGNVVIEDAFELTANEDTYSGTFPVAIESLEPGSTVSYRLIARDISVAGNETVLPETDYYVFNIIIEGGIFRQYDFENEVQGITGTNAWGRTTPAYGVNFAHSGEFAWATSPAGAYPASPELATLELPAMNLIGIPEAYLVFWHWYDAEHNGSASPDSPANTTLWDGGNVKVSVDDGTTWTLLTPDNGYNGTIASGRQNPLDGEPAFGGYSFGWRQEIVPLPVGTEVRLRFDFGSDAGNTETAIDYAGWLLDDITVLIERRTDTNAPQATLLPQANAVREAGQLPPEPYVELFDSTGVADVFIDYAFLNDAGVPDGSYRLAMSTSRSLGFSGAFPFAATTSFNVGDVLTYRLRVSDFAGNTNTFPAQDDPPFKIEYRLMDSIDLLGDAKPTGMWSLDEAAWVLVGQEPHNEVSSLVWGPLDLPANVDNLQVVFEHEHSFLANHGGNLKLSTDFADSWAVLTPVQGYRGNLSDADTVPASMRGQEAITGQQAGTQLLTFDLLDHKGQQVWLRVDFGAQSKLAGSEFWRLRDATLSYSTLETVNGGFDVPRNLTLHANYPDPFVSQTTLGYTLATSDQVKLSVYDILGREVRTLVDAQQPAGTYTLELDGSALPNGLYLLRLETTQGTRTERMIISR